MDKAIGVNSFPQRSLNVREKASGAKTTDPLKMSEAFGEKNLSEVLNSVADPNFTTAKRKVKGVGSAEMDKDAFFKLMLTQLKQQDPTNPLKSHEMAAQLAQFSSVEQLSNMNETLNRMSQQNGSDSKYEVLNLIGKQVSGDSSQIDRLKGDKDHKIEFNLTSPAEKATVSIKDNKGVVVKKYDLTDLKKGKNQLVWNGLHGDGQDARVGQYTAHIEAIAQGRKIPADTTFKGAVDGVQFTAQGPVLIVDGKSLNLKDVKTIEVPQQKPEPMAQNLMAPDMKVSEGAMEAPVLANFDAAKMDNELREKLEGKPQTN